MNYSDRINDHEIINEKKEVFKIIENMIVE